MRILHVIPNLSGGGATRAMMNLINRSEEFFEATHSILPLGGILGNRDDLPQGPYTIIDNESDEVAANAIAANDIVLVHYWYSPYLNTFFSKTWPATRLILWFHISGETPPQYTSKALAEYGNISVAASRYASEIKTFDSVRGQIPMGHIDAVADFSRIDPDLKIDHDTYNVGYIGNLRYAKMRRSFVHLCKRVNVPNARFIVVGGDQRRLLAREAERMRCLERFEFTGSLEDIGPAVAKFDVYGYPLAPHTSAGSELNIQEVMYASVPCVVFPQANVRYLIEHEKTGLVVNTESEYGEALEYLYHNPSTRLELGANAREFVQREFVEKPSALHFATVFRQAMTLEPDVKEPLNVVASLELSRDYGDIDLSGTEQFLSGMADVYPEFSTSFTALDDESIFAAEDRIRDLPKSLLWMGGGLATHRILFMQDPWIRMWLGLMQLGVGRFWEAEKNFLDAKELGFDHWRIDWYIAEAKYRRGDSAQAAIHANEALRANPQFLPAQKLVRQAAFSNDG